MRTLIDIAKTYLVSAATPLCLDLLKKIDNEDFEGILSVKITPSSYTNATHYLLDSQALAFFSKNASLVGKGSQSPRLTAWNNWLAAERKCKRTNDYLTLCVTGLRDQHRESVASFLGRVRKKVAWWLGPLPETLRGSFGPGVTLCCRGKVSTIPDKITAIPTVTASVMPLLIWWYESSWARALEDRKLITEGRPRVNITRESEWSSVPKTALTDRSIEIGPSLNVYHQLFIGKTMKRRFRHRGWDLRFAADLHVRVARESSITGRYATIDLKQASDSVSRSLVRACVPAEWYELLDDLRVSFVKKDGQSYLLEKFSGMGNGFTFELESVLFMAICQTVLEDLGLPSMANRDCFVFGDDIIVPTEAAAEVIAALRLCGFDTNEAKTFVSGPFRESCGGDFFAGRPVRPHYVKESPSEPQQWIALANGLRRVAKSHFGDLSRAPDFLKPWFCVLDALPSALRNIRGPEDLGDLVIHDDDPSRWSIRVKNSIRFVRVYRPFTRSATIRQGGTLIGWEEFPDGSIFASRLYINTAPSRVASRPLPGVAPRNGISGYKLGWVAYS